MGRVSGGLPGFVELRVDGGDEEFRRRVDGLQRLLQLSSIDFVGRMWKISGCGDLPNIPAKTPCGTGSKFEPALM